MRLIAVFVAAVWAATVAAPALADTGRSEIANLLTRSAADWNRGDLDGFMHSYENSPSTTYVSSKSIVRGYANIRAHYAAHYGAKMGTLSISDVAVRPLGEDYAVVVARWHLATTSGARPSGIFTLVLHRTDGWHIVTDHSP